MASSEEVDGTTNGHGLTGNGTTPSDKGYGTTNGNGYGSTENGSESVHKLGKPKKVEEEATYWNLMKKNRAFRLYICSFIITHMGEWLTYIASIALAEEFLTDTGTTSRTTISILVVVRLLPNVFLSPFGGILADGADRRKTMILLDILGSICPLFFLVAMYYRSILIIYLVTILQQTISGLYEPCVSAILPLMVADMPQSDNYLKKATTIQGLSWSLFAAVGSALGGVVLTYLGFRACFFLDSCTYLLSAFLMYLVGGTWNVASDAEKHLTVLGQIKGMAVDGFNYLRTSFFGALVLLKASNCVSVGASDVLNVSFSEPNGMDDPYTSTRLGVLFACMGFGCFLFPLMADRLVDMKHPTSIQKMCIVSLAISALGFGGIAFFEPFWCICFFTLVRAGGASVNWILSSILLQKFSSDEMMGRVLSVDFALALLFEATSAYAAGFLQDQLHMGAHLVAFCMSCLGLVLSAIWLLYHLAGRGAGAAPKDESDNNSQGGNESTPLV
ncbi:Pfam:DUF894 [Seminavis robusta]|uniref:Pfam:DUF894 n=1 Tax=Seminavis robusta TaxID=568900 RepID=A0A9N8H9C1_9STRA|nr:Pfam:DUF894 [Seminavis robusta]|eukprot:Sro249_g098830.1 Pfam:DUF894 (503) ;mRNA; r:71625-73217